MEQELDLFKQLDLRQYAASIGYAVDHRESSRNSTAMRKDHDKIIFSLKSDDHYTYWSPRDDQDRGTIIDFVQKRKGLSLGGVTGLGPLLRRCLDSTIWGRHRKILPKCCGATNR